MRFARRDATHQPAPPSSTGHQSGSHTVRIDITGVAPTDIDISLLVGYHAEVAHIETRLALPVNVQFGYPALVNHVPRIGPFAQHPPMMPRPSGTLARP